ncbi:MAG: hypothetical protein DHS20C06_08180 [Hyphobacterium sp.]|nr:MAG: hypothetical protein DHS20C06_08180 [Hyphobacterium sp.]
MLKSVTATGLALLMVGCASAADLGWMEGHWRSEAEGRVSEEIWTSGEGGLYLAVNRTIRDGQARGFEFLRILETSEGAAYCAQPGDSEAVCFEQVAISENSVTFENPDHDFPQRVTYARDGEALTATISDMSGEQSMRFGWTLYSGD